MMLLVNIVLLVIDSLFVLGLFYIQRGFIVLEKFSWSSLPGKKMSAEIEYNCDEEKKSEKMQLLEQQYKEVKSYLKNTKKIFLLCFFLVVSLIMGTIIYTEIFYIHWLIIILQGIASIFIIASYTVQRINLNRALLFQGITKNNIISSTS